VITIIHKPCNGIAFFYEHMPRAGEQFDVEYAFDINGNPLTWDSSRLCPISVSYTHLTLPTSDLV